jgi:hypothetical protein
MKKAILLSAMFAERFYLSFVLMNLWNWFLAPAICVHQSPIGSRMGCR